MSNNAVLLNIPSRNADLNALQGEWLGVASGRYRVPAPWFYMFDACDLAPSVIYFQSSRLVKAEMLNPCTSVAEAKSRLALASRTFESSALEPGIVRKYWNRVISQLDSLPHPYLTIDATEILLMTGVKESAQKFARAFGSEADAIDLVKEFSCFVEKDPNTHADALDGGFFAPEYWERHSRTTEARKNWDSKLDSIPFAWKLA